MSKLQSLLHREAVRLPFTCLFSTIAGYLLSIGTVCGVPSPLAAALAGAMHPLSAFCILVGSLLAYLTQGTPESMRFLLAALTGTASLRLLFLEAKKPHVLAIFTSAACVLAGLVTELFFVKTSGMLPLYVLEAMAIGAGVYVLADARDTFRECGKICLDAGKGFTFAMVYLLGITGLCGLDLQFCNLGRTVGFAVTLMAAKKFRQTGGTLCGSLTACGVTLCGVPLGTPTLFLPVVGMLAGFLSHLPNALLIPIFFLMQFLSSAVFDGSMEIAKVLAELLIGCCLFGLCSHMDWKNWIRFRRAEPAAVQYLPHREQFLAEAFSSLRNETSSVMRKLRPEEPPKGEDAARELLCDGCSNYVYCWEKRREQTAAAFQRMFHYPDANPKPEALDGCLRRNRMTEQFLICSHAIAMQQLQNIHMHHTRAGLLQYLQLLEELTSASAARQQLQICEAETTELQEILRTCGCTVTECFVRRLKSGRYAAEVYTRDNELPVSAVREMLSDCLEVPMQEMEIQKNGKNRRFCFFQKPHYALHVQIHSITAKGYTRCGDAAAAVTDAVGNQYLILCDGMGSGSRASLTAQLAVHTFTHMIACGLPAESTIRLINTMLLSETGTEHFTTLDILRLDADTGTLRMYKSGASATLVQHHKQVTRIAAPSFPVGILTDAEPFCKQINGYEHDIIIMSSDGIHEAEYPFIRELLLQKMPLADLVKAVCEKAPIWNGGKQEDDITVIAASILCPACEQTIQSCATSEFVHNKQVSTC